MSLSLLFVSTFVCFSGYLTPTIIKFLMSSFYSENKADKAARAEIRQLEQEMAGISLVNEFARFTRLQRRQTKLKEELKNNVSARLSSRNQTQMFLTYGNKFFTIIFSMFLMYMYGKEPVAYVPQKLTWPLQGILSWPNSDKDAISLTVWMILTRLVVDSSKQIVS